MCLLVDANRAHVLFGQPGSEVAAPIWAWLGRDGILIYGGKLAEELGRLGDARRLLLRLNQAGKAILEDGKRTNDLDLELQSRSGLRSNDAHILALAEISGARVVFTEDTALMKDFTNPKMLRPRGRVYRYASHNHLLGHRPGCRKGAKP
jgi:hypothetical protein